MAAAIGNNYWEFRNKHGRDFKYNPELLEEESIKYYEWVRDNPLWESVLVARGITINKGEESEQTVYSTAMPKMRAMTLKAFQLFADISHTTWDNYKKNKDFVAITTRIEDIIYSQKFEGAAATLLNPNIIARDLGLAETKDHKSSDGSMTPKTTIVTTLTKKELKEAINK